MNFVCFKRQQSSFWFQTQKYNLFYYYLDDMFRSTDHYQAALQTLE